MTTGSAFLLASTGLVGGLLLLSRFSWPRRRRAAPLDDSGSAAMEMVIVLPLFLTTIMVVVQCTHLMFATVLLEHAAFCVSRSASVQISQTVDGEAPNQLSGGTSRKLEKLTDQANALMSPTNKRYNPLPKFLPSWKIELGDYLAGSFVPSPDDLYGAPVVVSDLVLRNAAGAAAQFLEKGGFVGRLTKWRLNLALARVEIRNTSEAGDKAYASHARSFMPSAILDVKVVYEYPLDVPAGGNLLGPLIGYLPDLGPAWLRERLARLGGFGYRVDISSTYRVVNWGQPEAPATP